MAGRHIFRIVTLVVGFALVGAAPLRAAEVVLVPAKVIYPGETIAVGALKELTLLEGKVPPANVAIAIADLEGKVAKRTLLPGRYVQQNALREAYVVEKGVPVEMVFVAGAMQISAAAVSLEAGSTGDLVKLRNIDTGKVVAGIVMADGSVRISGE